MANLKEQLSKFCDYVEKTCGIPVIKAKRSFVPQMNGSFISIGFGEIEPQSKDISQYYDEKTGQPILYQKIRGLYFVTFLIQCFGNDAIDRLRHLRSSRQTPMFEMWCEENSFGTAGVSSIQDISATLLDSVYEERAQIEMSFYINCEEIFEDEYFDHEDFTLIKGNKMENFTVPEQEGIRQ